MKREPKIRCVTGLFVNFAIDRTSTTVNQKYFKHQMVYYELIDLFKQKKITIVNNRVRYKKILSIKFS